MNPNLNSENEKHHERSGKIDLVSNADFKAEPLSVVKEEHKTQSRTLPLFLIFSALIAAGLYYSGALNNKDHIKHGDDIVFSNLYAYYGISPLPTTAFRLNDLTKNLSLLSQEPCNENALKNATDLLAGSEYKREAIAILLAYTNKCPNTVGALIRAGDLLLNMGNYEGSLTLANKAIHQNPAANLAILLRAEALRLIGRHSEAIESYSDFIGSYADQSKIVSLVFTNMALSYAAEGKFCEAASTLQTYIAFDYSHRRNNAFDNEINNYENLGHCGTGYAKGRDEFIPISQGVILAKAEIDGVTGNFQIDTGASFVNLSPDFARKLHLHNTGDHLVNLSTANGEIDVRMLTVRNIKLGGLSADNVPASILRKPIRKDIDGLLGLSFLSRFFITTRGKTMIISSSDKVSPRKSR